MKSSGDGETTIHLGPFVIKRQTTGSRIHFSFHHNIVFNLFLGAHFLLVHIVRFNLSEIKFCRIGNMAQICALARFLPLPRSSCFSSSSSTADQLYKQQPLSQLLSQLVEVSTPGQKADNYNGNADGGAVLLLLQPGT